MKKLILTTLALAAFTLVGCKSSEQLSAEQLHQASWQAFCAAKGYDLNQTDYATTNEYLDSWCGSAEEEETLAAAGIKLY